jgi:ubiquinone/menaquinone biosynthesis C-methylase UbiE
MARFMNQRKIVRKRLGPEKESRIISVGKDEIRRRLLKYTRKAFRMLPRLDKPRILDIGCGSGIPSLELARLSGGEVIGIDIDRTALDRFSEKIQEAGLSGRVKAVNGSLLNMDFEDKSFDIVLSEGSIYAIGFDRGLRDWKRFLKPGGFMVIHDEQGSIDEKLKQISHRGYELLGFFTMSEEVWWKEYFAPLEKWIAGSQARQIDNPKILEEIHQAQVELEMFKRHPERNRSVCFVIKKK